MFFTYFPLSQWEIWHCLPTMHHIKRGVIFESEEPSLCGETELSGFDTPKYPCIFEVTDMGVKLLTEAPE
jgi:hypothetical protein